MNGRTAGLVRHSALARFVTQHFSNVSVSLQPGLVAQQLVQLSHCKQRDVVEDTVSDYAWMRNSILPVPGCARARGCRMAPSPAARPPSA